jgi:hypothetical protein
MTGGRFRALTSLIRRGRETHEGTGQALRDAYHDGARDPFSSEPASSPMEAEADDAMRRCIEALNDVEGTLRGRLNKKPD